VRYRRIAVLIALLAVASAARAEPVTVAVASNFHKSAEQLAALYRATDAQAEIRFSPASSGKLFAQVENGAPFDVFLSADSERPAQLEQKGLAVAGSRFTYAYGRLVLWSNDPTLAGKDCRQALTRADFRHLAIASPKAAPYGVAAVAVLDKLHLGLGQLGERVVQGENIAQTLHFVVTGAAQLGFVALSQLRDPGAPAGTCRWEVPADLHPPIAQQAVLLKRAAANKSAAGFVQFLKGDAARKLIASHGYDTATLIAGQ
jgi:molybdate transport system substrate-binding protein